MSLEALPLVLSIANSRQDQVCLSEKIKEKIVDSHQIRNGIRGCLNYCTISFDSPVTHHRGSKNKV